MYIDLELLSKLAELTVCLLLARTLLGSVQISVVSDLQISLVGELSLAIAIIFDGVFGEFAFS